MKTKKIKLSVAVSVAVSAVAVVMVVGLVSVVAANGFSLKEMIAQIAGQGIVNELKSSGALDNSELSFGAMPGNELQGPEFKVAGVSKQYVRDTMASATTTLCAFKNPYGAATSTLESYDYQITTGTSTDSTIVVNASTLRHASSTATNIGSVNTVASGATDSWAWSQNTASMDIGEVSPNEYILLQTEGVGLSGYTYKGTCQAVFRGF